MKRFLAILLTVIMIGGLMPQAFAGDTAVYSPKYVFNYTAFGSTADNVVLEDSAKSTNTYNNSTFRKEVSSGVYEYAGFVPYANRRSATLYKEELMFYTGTTEPNNDNALSLKLTVEKSGTYVPSFEFKKYAYAGLVDIYLVSTDYAAAKGWNAFSDSNKAAIVAMVAEGSMTNPQADVKHIASVDLNNRSDIPRAEEPKNEIAESVSLTAGTYYMYAVVNKAGVTSSDSGRTYGSIKYFNLENKGAVSVAAEKSELRTGNTTTVSAEVTDGTGNAVEDAVITYESSDTDVATVDASTGLVTAVSDGTATITASTTLAGVKVSGSVEITVNSLIDLHYDFRSFAVSSTGGSVLIAEVTSASQLIPTISSGAWTYHSAINLWPNSLTNSCMQPKADTNPYGEDNALVLNAWVDKAGTYAVSGELVRNPENGTSKIYFVPKAYAAAKQWDMSTLDGVMAAKADSLNAGSEVCLAAEVDMNSSIGTSTIYTGNTVKLSEKEFYIVISVAKGSSTRTDGDAFSMLRSIDLKRQPSVKVSTSSASLDIGKTATLTSVVMDKEDNIVDSVVTYESLNTKIATVEGSVVTAVSAGTAAIKATAANGATDTIYIKVHEKTVSLALATNLDETPTVSSKKPGTLTVSAPDKSGEGYTFSHWVRGTATKGVWVSSDPSYIFNLVSNTYLTAIYVKNDANIVEFFNGNGELLAQKEVVEGKVEEPTDPKMVGFTFIDWILGRNGDTAIPFVNENITNSLRVVADYEVESTTYTVGDKTDLIYDAEVIKTADSEDTVWKRDGKPVGYGKTYTYNVWSNTTITSEAFTGEKTPLVYLDTNTKTVGDETAYMIEFDGADKEIVEVGILFSSAGTPEVGSCMYKATSKTNGGDDNHGQFTAKPANSAQTKVRGYLIYKDGTEYKVEYSD